VGTEDNDETAPHLFTLHKLYSNKPSRYIPYKNIGKLTELIKANNTDCIICEHPYMALTAIRLSQQLKLPWFMHSHNIESQRFKDLGKGWWKILQMYEQYGMLKSQGVFFVAPEDAEFAIKHFSVQPDRCHVIPFGTKIAAPPVYTEQQITTARQQLGLDKDTKALYFLGLQSYGPNADAVNYIVDEVMPRLQQTGLKYEVFIAGKGLPEEIQQKITNTERIRYTGFVDNLDDFLMAMDVMLNPVMGGGGIKTKAVEALAANKMLVSSQSGAAGLIPSACGNNLLISENNWDSFVSNIVTATQQQPAIPQAFFDIYNLGNIARKTLSIMSEVVNSPYR
jgi:glycosyltransferase involved in cell wall biosynthesis